MVGGGVAGLLLAASPIQVMPCSFSYLNCVDLGFCCVGGHGFLHEIEQRLPRGSCFLRDTGA